MAIIPVVSKTDLHPGWRNALAATASQLTEAGVGVAPIPVAARVAARMPYQLLVEEVGEEAAASFREWFEATAIQAGCLRKLCLDVARVASPIGIPVVFLKGLALLLSGAQPPGSRPISDVDILVPSNEAAALQNALIEAGYRERTLLTNTRLGNTSERNKSMACSSIDRKLSDSTL